MLNRMFLGIAVGILAVSCQSAHERISPVPFSDVVLTGGFWKDRMKVEMDVTVPFSVKQSAHAVKRFEECAAFRAGRDTVRPVPHRFISSDLYKVMEGVSYSLMHERSDSLEAFMDYVINLIAESQLPDGYLYLSHICGNPIPSEMGAEPYSWVVHSHELYNVGHLYEAAVAYYQATGKTKFLNIATKSADHIYKVFFEGDPAYNDGKPVNQAPGHEEIELALCKLYKVTDNKKYLKMAKRFLDIRGVTYRPDGEGIMSPTYAQQHLPISEQVEPVGHAVRAAYLYTAMAQVDALTGRDDYKHALESIWENLVNTRMHITGGLGAIEGIEGFGPEYVLPNLTAYNETCAAVANVFFNHGLFLTEGDGKYMDIAELSLFNNALAGVNLAGDRFFYVNPLESDGITPFNHGNTGRSEWFECACCPPNISRLILQVAGYMYACSDRSVYVTLYGGSRTEIPVNGETVCIEQKSEYPFDGKVHISVSPENPVRFSLKLRIPTWSSSEMFIPGDLYTFTDEKTSSPEIQVNGKPAKYEIEKGFAVISRKWEIGDSVELNLPVIDRLVECSSEIESNRNMLAVTRGPLVYCAEEADNGCPIPELMISDSGQMTDCKFVDGVMKGITKVSTTGYRKARNGNVTPSGIVLVPYYSWNNRGDGKTMRVWLPRY